MAKKLTAVEQKASKSVLDSLRKETSGMLKGKMDGLKKVTVASNSPSGLAKGLDLAKKIAGKSDSSLAEGESCPACGEAECGCEEGSSEEEALESPEMEHDELLHGGEEAEEKSPEEMSPEELDAKIQELLALKHAKQAQA